MDNLWLRRRVLSLLLGASCFAGIALWNNCTELAGCARCFAADMKDDGSGKKPDMTPFVPPLLSELDAKAGWIGERTVPINS
jgi:hypothetical protein